MNEHHILQVEDNPDDVLLVQRSFRKAGVAAIFHTAHDGDAAVAYLSGLPTHKPRPEHPLPSLVLLDLKLPRRSGFEVLAWLRAQPGLRWLPVVVLTSSDEAQDVARAYETGANSYLVKPVSAEAMLTMAATLANYWLSMNRQIRL